MPTLRLEPLLLASDTVSWIGNPGRGSQVLWQELCLQEIFKMISDEEEKVTSQKHLRRLKKGL